MALSGKTASGRSRPSSEHYTPTLRLAASDTGCCRLTSFRRHMNTQRDTAHFVVSSCWKLSLDRAVHTCGDGTQRPCGTPTRTK
jgi:hypothetical protein